MNPSPLLILILILILLLILTVQDCSVAIATVSQHQLHVTIVTRVHPCPQAALQLQNIQTQQEVGGYLPLPLSDYIKVLLTPSGMGSDIERWLTPHTKIITQPHQTRDHTLRLGTHLHITYKPRTG